MKPFAPIHPAKEKMVDRNLKLGRSEEVARIVLNRPDSLNAFDFPVGRES